MSTPDAPGDGFTPEEKAAMRERAAEVAPKKRKAKADPAADAAAAIAAMNDTDRALAEALHALVAEVAPELSARTWYGMPAYALKGKVIVFFQASGTFNTRYCTLGFSDSAALDEGTMWPTAYALTAMDEAERTHVAALIRRAAGQPAG